VPEGKLCKSWRGVGERCLAVMSDYAAVEMEQDEEKGFRPDIWLRACNGWGAMIHEFGGDSVGKWFSSQPNQGLISLERTPRAVATSCWVAPWRSIVTARFRSSLLKRGILQQHFSYEMTTGFVKWVLTFTYS
jgi:hypothetical protein